MSIMSMAQWLQIGGKKMLIPDNAYIIESEYCNRDEYKIVKRKQVEKYKDKYPDVKCVLVPSDTRGLRMWVTYSMYFK